MNYSVVKERITSDVDKIHVRLVVCVKDPEVLQIDNPRATLRNHFKTLMSEKEYSRWFIIKVNCLEGLVLLITTTAFFAVAIIRSFKIS